MSEIASQTNFKLPATLDLAAADGFLTAMRSRIESSLLLRVDASEVRTLTSPCLQIIVAAMRSGVSVTIDDPSPEFVAAFADMGFDLMALCEVGAPQAGGIVEDNPDQNGTGDDCADNDGKGANGVGGREQGEPSAQSTPVDNVDCMSDQPRERMMAKRILTIDDSKTIRDMLMLTLADAGFDVVQAVDGQDGLDVLEKERVDLVITDINMPRMDGYEVIRKMRSNVAYKSMPVLVLTTESEAEKKNLARAAGATGWMVKPFDPDRLIATINKVAP